MDNLAQWLDQELRKHEWRQTDLARRAGIPDATLSRIMAGTRRAGPDVCLALANALGLPPEQVFRAADLLPPMPESVEEEEEAVDLFRRSGEQMRTVALGILRVLARRADHAEKAGGLVQESTDASPLQALPRHLAWEIVRDLEAMPPEDQRKVLEFIQRLRDERREASMKASLYAAPEEGG